MTRAALSHAELGQSSFSADTAAAFATYLGWSIQEVMEAARAPAGEDPLPDASTELASTRPVDVIQAAKDLGLDEKLIAQLATRLDRAEGPVPQTSPLGRAMYLRRRGTPLILAARELAMSGMRYMMLEGGHDQPSVSEAHSLAAWLEWDVDDVR